MSGGGNNKMIVVVEGIDRVGKTTLVNKLVKAGFIELKDEFVIHEFIHEFDDYSIGKCESFVQAAKKLHNAGYNVVIDRLHLTEFVYGMVKSRGVNQHAVWAVDMLLTNLDALLCYVRPADIEISNGLAGLDQAKYNEMFEFAVKLSSIKRIETDFTKLDDAFQTIMFHTKKYDFYFASPFFNEEQIEREERMKEHLRGLGFTVFSPKESCFLPPTSGQKERFDVFESNCNAIRSSKAVFAVTDGKDMGTVWEAGFAYGIKTPIVYFAETLGNNQFNLMLAQSGVDVFTSQEEVTFDSLANVLRGNTRAYRGEIE